MDREWGFSEAVLVGQGGQDRAPWNTESLIRHDVALESDSPEFETCPCSNPILQA